MQPIFRKLELKNILTPKFVMTPIELKDYVDFEAKRNYFISKPTGSAGGHSHKEEKELFVMLQGTCTALIDRGNGLEGISMEGMKTALYIGSYVWHYFEDFSTDAILMAISSTNYNPDRSDYIEDYQEYKKAMGR